MTECEQAGRLSAYHDDELGAEAAAAMERHLRQCASCAAELGRLRGLSKLMGGLDWAQPPAPAMRRFHATAALAGSGAVRHWAEALTAVAAAVLVTFTLWLWRTPPAGPASVSAPTWEVSAIRRPAESASAGSDDQFAAWVAQDLSQQEAGHGKN